MIIHNFDKGDHCLYCAKTWYEAQDPETAMPTECKIGPKGIDEIEREAIIIMKVIKLIKDL